MGDSLDDELTALRARAYAADADILGDPEALDRLRELEDRERALRAAPPRPPAPFLISSPLDAPPRPADPAPAATTAPIVDTAPAAESAWGVAANARPTSPVIQADEPPAPASPAPAAGRLRVRRVLAIGAVGALIGAAIGIPITVWASGLADRPYAVLHRVDSDTSGVFLRPGADAFRYEDFLGIRVSTGPLEYAEGTCIVIELDPAKDQAYSSDTTRGDCAISGFDAILDVSATDGYVAPDVRAAIDDLSALRFAVVGDEVHVFVATAPAEAEQS